MWPAKSAGIRFYKGNGITGTHTGSLWSETGTLLATGTFTNETLSGWQVLQFSSPVAISANTTYVASYNTDTGAYSVSLHYFLTQGGDNAPLHALGIRRGWRERSVQLQFGRPVSGKQRTGK